MGHRRRASRPWAVGGLFLADVVVFVLYALSRSPAVLVAAVVGLVAIVVAVVADKVGRPRGRRRRSVRGSPA